MLISTMSAFFTLTGALSRMYGVAHVVLLSQVSTILFSPKYSRMKSNTPRSSASRSISKSRRELLLKLIVRLNAAHSPESFSSSPEFQHDFARNGFLDSFLVRL